MDNNEKNQIFLQQQEINHMIQETGLSTQALIFEKNQLTNKVQLLENENSKIFAEFVQQRKINLQNNNQILELTYKNKSLENIKQQQEQELKESHLQLLHLEKQLNLLKQKFKQQLTDYQLKQKQNEQNIQKQNELLQQQFYNTIKQNKAKTIQKDLIIKDFIAEQKQLLSQIEYLNVKYAEQNDQTFESQNSTIEFKNQLNSKDDRIAQYTHDIQLLNQQIKDYKEQLNTNSLLLEQYKNSFQDVKNAILLFKFQKQHAYESVIQKMQIQIIQLNSKVISLDSKYKQQITHHRKKIPLTKNYKQGIIKIINYLLREKSKQNQQTERYFAIN